MLVSILILTIVGVSLAQVLALAIIVNSSEGQLATKVSTFAHDKIEKLSNLPFDNSGLERGGSLFPNSPTSNYVDYLDPGGSITTSDNANFVRQWMVEDVSSTFKKISVSVAPTRNLNSGPPPSATLVTYKSQYFETFMTSAP